MKFLKNYFFMISLCILAHSASTMEAVSQNTKTLQEKFHRLCQIVEPQPDLLFADYYRIRDDIINLPKWPFGMPFDKFMEEILSQDMQLSKSGFNTKYLARNGHSFNIFFFAALYYQYFSHGKISDYDAKTVDYLSNTYKLPKSSVDPLLFVYRTSRGERWMTLYGLISSIIAHADTLHDRMRFDRSAFYHLTEQERIFEKNFYFLSNMLDGELFQRDLSYRDVRIKNFLETADKEKLAAIISAAIKQKQINNEWILPFMH